MSENRGNPKRIESLVINEEETEFGDGASLLNPESGQMLLTNPVGHRIIELADGSHDMDAIVARIVKDFKGIDDATAREHAETFLATATEKGIVTWTGQA